MTAPCLKVAYVSHLARIRSIVVRARARLKLAHEGPLKCFESVLKSLEKECLRVLKSALGVGLGMF